MGNAEQIQPEGERLKKALRWISETVRESPDRPRGRIITEAAVRFDLSPCETDFLERDITPPAGGRSD